MHLPKLSFGALAFLAVLAPSTIFADVPSPPPATVSWSTITAGAAVRAAAVDHWYAVATWHAVEAWHAAERQPSQPRHGTAPVRSSNGGGSASGTCGGDLPSCSIMQCESGGSLTAHNSSGADGKWQIMPGTWRTDDTNGDGKPDSYRGYANPSDAPESVQDARAREVWAGGRGRGQWAC